MYMYDTYDNKLPVMFEEREMLLIESLSRHIMGGCSLKQNLCFIRKVFPINKVRIDVISQIVIRALHLSI